MAWWLLLLMLLAVVILWIVKIMHFSHRDCLLSQRLDGKVVIVTGCNQGIGYETVGELLRRGARVIMACRDLNKAELARRQLLKRFAGSPESDKQHSVRVTETQLTCEELDLESPASIRAFASRMRKQEQVVHILVNNAAINLRRAQFDADGIERHLKVNHLGPFLLTQLLYPLLQLADGDARVINVSSFNHRLADLNMSDLCRPKVGSYYSNSKLANVIHAKELSRRWQESGIVSVSLHPGLVKTELFRHMPLTRWIVHTLLGWLSKSAWQGAQTVIHCCLADDLIPGAYYHECRVARTSSQASDPDVGKFLWQASEKLIDHWESSSSTSG
ncbi:hypothetical protein P879_05225 [Paragonimus westermani]|uniref:Retinol dehydrogenase 12 n=1 Tax=Paragonimus westermani TaxID=34504 RepID=A0A8T0DUP1_9TREM|nr:hypothetical protein P879_05225 [Paragonimus westermani]